MVTRDLDNVLLGTSLKSKGGESLEAAVKEVSDNQSMAVAEGVASQTSLL